METTELVPVISFNLPAIKTNFSELRTQLVEGLKKYDIEVTAENLPEAKGMATDLNKLSKVLAGVRKEKAGELAAPIKDFENQAKELEQLCQEGREKLLAQIKTFEDETRLLVSDALAAALEEKYAEKGVRPKFQTATFGDLVILSNLTKSKNLTAGVMREIEGRADKCHANQLQYDGRLARLEADCLKAGLATPLEEAHVANILNRSDADYTAGLEQLIKIELGRQKAAEERLQKAAEEKVRREETERIRKEEEAKAKIAREEAARIAAEEKARRDAEEAKVAAERAAAEAAKPKPVPQPAVPPVAPRPTKDSGPGVDLVVAFRSEMFDSSDEVAEYLLASGIATKVYNVAFGGQK